MSAATALTGLIPILSTPFGSDGEVDLASLRRLVEFQLASGVDGLAVLGMASEGFALTAGDRTLIVECVRDVAGDRVPLVAGVCPTSLATSLEQADDLVSAGVDALMVLPPVLVSSTPEQLYEFYATHAERLGVHIMVQDAQGVTGQAIGVDLIEQLGRVDGIGSVKVEAQPTAPKLAAVRQRTPNDFQVLGGANALFLLEELSQGSVGTMPACEFSDGLRRVIDDWNRGDEDSARDGYDALLPLIRFGMQPGLAWAVHKEVLVMRGIIDTATVRLPARALDDPSRAQLRRIVDRLGSLPS